MVYFEDIEMMVCKVLNKIYRDFIYILFLDGTWTTVSNIIEQDDQIEIDGQIFHKPFVEKPVSAENHDVYIYFPSSAGGGSQRLFRKVNYRRN